MHEISGQLVSNVSVLDRADAFAARDAQVRADANATGATGDSTAAFPWTLPASLVAGSFSYGLPGYGATAPGAGLSGAASGSVIRVDTASLSKLTGISLLDQLGLMPRSELARYIADNPRSVKELVANPPAAKAVTAWWAAQPSSARKSLVDVAPAMVGNLSGLPSDVRNTANRRYLKQSIAQLKSSMSRLGRGEVVTARLRLHMLEQVRDALGSSTAQQPKSLLTFDADGYGRAAIVVGDLDTADYVSYLVPGMFFSVDTALNTWTNIATDLNREQTQWISRLAEAEPAMAGKTVATVAWIGYQTPGITDIASLTLADQGADLIGRAVEGVKAVRSGGTEPFVTIIGHSYGSTAAMIELAKGGLDIDALALIGSPGSAAQTAADLSVRNDNVYVGEAAWDPVVNSAFYGSDPGSGAFGAHRMSVAGGVDPITHRALTASAGHLGYFAPGSESMRNLALIALDHGSLVTQGTTLDASRTLN